MDKTVLISVITPCFNSEKTISQTLESMLSQSYQNYEYILIDGGSTDNTIEIIKQYEPKFGGKLKYISEKDNGIYDAMNKGIKLAKGDMIGIVNSDDYYEKDSLKAVAEVYDSKVPYLILYGAVRYVNQNCEELKISIIHHRSIGEDMIYHPATFVSRSIYRDMFLYDLQYRYSSDLDFILKANENKDIVFKPIYQVLSNFREGGASNSKAAALEVWKVLYRHGVISKKKYHLSVMKENIKDILS